MTTGLADVLKQIIVDANFAFTDRITGMVRVASLIKEGAGGSIDKPVTKRISVPVGCNVTNDDCIKGKYTDLCPNSKKKSILYFEESGATQSIGKVGANIKMRSSLRLVGWLNQKLLGNTDCSISPQIVAAIIAAMPWRPVNSGVFTKLVVTVVQEQEKSAAIFSKYSYDEAVVQYLLYPYDYFALNITCEYVINPACIADFTLNDPLCNNQI